MLAARDSSPTTRVKFGVFEADLKSGELRRSGVRVRIQSQPFKVLTILLESRGEVVTREELQDRIWGQNTTVDFDHSLGIAINKLREALGDSAENPRFVETLARRGYRFIAPILVDSPAGALPASAPITEEPEIQVPAAMPSRRWFYAAAGTLLIAIAAVAAVWLRPAGVKIRRINRITYSGRVLEPSIDVGGTSTFATDGTRLYFSQTENGRISLAQALIANGELGDIRLPSEIVSPVISAMSPDRSRLLVRDEFAGGSEQTFWIVPTLGSNAERIPNVLAHDATWMPDGKRILYARGNALFSAGTDGTDQRKIADLPGWAFWLRWSPDGRKLRFSIRDPIHQTTSIWEMNHPGNQDRSLGTAEQAGHITPLLPGWSHPESECCGTWTPDGKYFVFQSRHGGRSDLWIRRDGAAADPVQVTNGPLDFEAPITGTEGHRLYFIGANPEIGLLEFRNDSRAFARMDGSFSSAALAAFSRDGKWVAWLNTMDGSLWRSRSDGSDRFQLTAPPLRVFMMRWSPDDKKLAIMAEQPGQPWRIFILDASGGQLEPLLNEDLSEADPDWSSDGKWLVMGRLPQSMSPEAQPRALYEVEAGTRKVVKIPGSDGLFSPRLSPDDRFIAALNLTQRTLMLFDRNSGTWRVLSNHSAADPQWSHESTAIFFQDNLESGKPIYRADVRTGSLQVVARFDDLRPLSARDFRFIALAPGDLPVVSAWTSNVNLYSIDLDEDAGHVNSSPN